MKNNRPRGRPATPDTQILAGWLDGAQRQFLSHGFAHGSPALGDLLARCQALGRQKRQSARQIQGAARDWATSSANWPSGRQVEGTWLDEFAALALRRCQHGLPADKRLLLLMPRATADCKPPPTYTFTYTLVRRWTPRFKIRIIYGKPRPNESYYELLHTLETFEKEARKHFDNELSAFLESTCNEESKRLRSSTTTKLPSTLNDDLELAARYYLCNEPVETLAERVAHREPSVVRKRIRRVLRLLSLESRARPRRRPRK